ncbi:MAG: preprotein translocase subunit SecA [Candidatus Dormibacteraeota bacterium]|nr:preprotein translocase subunit SecA [Candidatus Dormibacteraeota bacterium]
MSVLTRIYDPTRREVRHHWQTVTRIGEREEEVRLLADSELQEMTGRFKARLEEGETLDDLLIEAFAVAREAARRTLGMRPFDVQCLGGIVLHQGKIAEMKTGEGKTLVAALPLYLNALTGRGCFLVTVNDFLARRDAGWNAPMFHALGMGVGVIIPEASFLYDPEYTDENHPDPRLRHLRPVERQEAYLADIVYATNNEMGFDYLRDNLARAKEHKVQRDRYYAIVDEVDSILVDEARTPLIISGLGEESTEKYYQYAGLIRQLKAETDYTIDEKTKSGSLTEEGIDRIEKMTGISDIYGMEHVEEAHQINQALKAHALYQIDRDYIVKDGEVVIVDEFTGRTMPGRRWSDGLHQAIEAKEGVRVQQEQRTLATVTFQNYFRTFEVLAGMTGTAITEAEEFHKIYHLEVVPIPTNRPMIRIDQPDLIFRSEEAKFKAIAEEIEERYRKGQPVLVGTVSIEKSERLSRLLEKRGVPHEVLNAKQHEREAEIVAGAGQHGAVTIATNMAGRGTDIVLGEGVADLGGLYIIGTERHESRRIDNQLRGRAGRQGDPGETRFFLSFEDDLMRVFGGERMRGLMGRLGLDEDTPIESGMVSRQIEGAQSRVEGYNFDNRRYVVEFDDVVNRQREIIYAERDRILEGIDTRTNLSEWLADVVRELVDLHCHGRHKQEWEMEALWERLRYIFPFPPSEEVELDQLGDTPPEVAETVIQEAERLYTEREEKYSPELVRQVEVQLMLGLIDERWADYLTTLEHLKDNIRWQSLGQRDPLVEFKAEAFSAFQGFQESLKQEIIRYLFHSQIQVEPTASQPLEGVASHPDAGSALQDGPDSGASSKVDSSNAAQPRPGTPSDPAEPTVPGHPLPPQPNLNLPTGSLPVVSRNALCPCGSGKKYKRCHGTTG